MWKHPLYPLGAQSAAPYKDQTMKYVILSAALCCMAIGALAHSGVRNAAVLARMDSMKVTGDAMKVMGDMAKGTTPFDANAARIAADRIAHEAARTPDLFMAFETDPKTEAKSAIWDNFEDFTAKAADLETRAIAVSATLKTSADLGPALNSLGTSCKACHAAYRE
jgi:cytochrome c556